MVEGTVEQILEELNRTLGPELVAMRNYRDVAARWLAALPQAFSPAVVVAPSVQQRGWEYAGLYLLHTGRVHEAIAIFSALYRQMLQFQEPFGSRAHKGMPLVWISECYKALGCPVLAKRYLMLTLAEDAVAGEGDIQADTSGVYFRLVWVHGLSDGELRRYARELWSAYQDDPVSGRYPEWLLQQIDQRWTTDYPSVREISSYTVNSHYVEWLLSRMGDGTGMALETLAEYLMSCMPGCRTTRRRRANSTDYDVVCAMEGTELDYRSELGRYFVCECKDWEKPADYSAVAKFCRVLDSTKARFGIIFSKNGVTGAATRTDGALELIKVFQDRAMVIAVLDLADLRLVAEGGNLIQILREKYERARLDLRA